MTIMTTVRQLELDKENRRARLEYVSGEVIVTIYLTFKKGECPYVLGQEVAVTIGTNNP